MSSKIAQTKLYFRPFTGDQVATVYAKKAFLHHGWANDVRLRISDGVIESIEVGCLIESDDFVADVIVPGIANAHSHAFQRALVGHCEQRGCADQDNFWSWREQMYRLAGLIDADGLAAIARQAYSEMMTFGYTSVAEFHYLHGDPAGGEKMGDLYRAILKAAADTGIRLTYVPILYERAGFDQNKPTKQQQRFAMTLNELVDHYEYARETTASNVTVGIGAHSLRAVSKPSLKTLADIVERDECPMHIHIAEQIAEVDQCLAQHNARPVEWLLGEFSLNKHWCLVHATHVSAKELEALSRPGAVVCLCPSTEANLGDGIFPLRSWLEQGGRIAIGSDSQITNNPFEELRWLEYGQRLSSLSRNVAAVHGYHTGRSLFEYVLEGGGFACGQGEGQLRPGSHADLLILDGENPMLAGHNTESILDALVFSGATLPISRVMVGGEWQVIDGVHVTSQQTRNDFLEVVQDLWPSN